MANYMVRKIRKKIKSSNGRDISPAVEKKKYQFIIMKNYPTQRRFTIRRKLKESVFDKIKDWLGF